MLIQGQESRVAAERKEGQGFDGKGFRKLLTNLEFLGGLSRTQRNCSNVMSIE